MAPALRKEESAEDGKVTKTRNRSIDKARKKKKSYLKEDKDWAFEVMKEIDSETGQLTQKAKRLREEYIAEMIELILFATEYKYQLELSENDCWALKTILQDSQD